MASADTVIAPWATGIAADGYEEVTGDVVWSDSEQAGYMRLSGLVANNADSAQYQLWIVDPDRDERPVDGGVFDVPAGVDEVIIPIDSKLDISAPAAFAITLEQPGGVVVSAGPLLVVAPVTG
jgi:anti-sigma-K factor RskA